MTSAPSFEELLAEGQAAPVAGWDFSWFEGRATEQRTSWGYSALRGADGPTADRPRSHADQAVAGAGAAGLRVIDVRQEATRVEFFDIAAVVHFLRKVTWTVPDFTVTRYRQQLAELHGRILREGRFVAHSQRYLIEARKP